MIIVSFHAWLLFSSMHDCFLPCMIIVSFHTCGLRWSICFLQSRRGSQGWQFLFLSRGVSHDRKGGVLLDLYQLFPSMHDYCFLPCIIIISFHACGLRWSIFFPSKQAGIAGMAVSFSIARVITWPEGRSDPKKKSHQKIFLLLGQKYMPMGVANWKSWWTQ